MLQLLKFLSPLLLLIVPFAIRVYDDWRDRRRKR